MTTAPNPPPPPPPPRNPIVAVVERQTIPLVEARYYTRGPRHTPAIWLVLHATHGAEGVGKAMDGALELANLQPGDRERSTHLIIDTTQVVQCVPFASIAWHAGHNANAFGESIELCGRADQTRAQWLDAQSLPMLCIAAGILRWRSNVLGIPLVHVGPADLVQHRSGVTTHAEITQAFPHDTNHTDPGPGFPFTELLAAARDAQLL
jgi:N-acetyl-anhydromuramyl-L-alanine amidase AmpD